MNENELYLPTWQELSESRQRTLFEQVLRYFINPLWQVTDIRPLIMQYRRQLLQSFQVELNGQTFLFVPGNLTAHLNSDVVAVSPFMITRTAVNANLYYLGELDMVTGESFGHTRELKSYQSEIEIYLSQINRQPSLDPFATPPQVIQTDHLTFGTTESETVPIYLQQDWSYAELRQALRRDGGNLPTPNQWQAAVTAGFKTFEVPVQQDWSSAVYEQFGYGMAFQQAQPWELLDDVAIVKPNPLSIGISDERELGEALAVNGDRETLAVAFEEMAYRIVFNVQLD
ncbi:hypothetical protein FC15_GL001482 [Lapidilactobacillus concavus DSM 17758]|uniref:Uncharacterized protein n=1 Tax=Lapidilactobacillus concavus DSM 17758 TaxID=1423735 RepID=A0A0R1VXD4_9LACO|nr:hypothetical protein [Lapidilactobacillus concavus]KRM10250.1 hypothetical protein FC15_GL001482 [Lapidilactobacillus concavus DSM 17758]GEL13334.1 hypothetical protein LCO01nite_08830 [Lapidilactobacillus concavus]